MRGVQGTEFCLSKKVTSLNSEKGKIQNTKQQNTISRQEKVNSDFIILIKKIFKATKLFIS